MIRELVQLRRGHGLHGPDLLERLGPGLRNAAAIGPEESQGDARRKLATYLATVIDELPPDLRLSVQAALAMAPASEQRFLKDRMIWLGKQLDRDPRTAARRVESGFALLAEQIVASQDDSHRPPETEYAPDGWYVDLLRSTLLFHHDPVQLMEARRIVATRELDRVSVSFSVPRNRELPPGRQIQVETVYGGRLQQDPELSTPTYWSGQLLLPRKLAAGEVHEYQVQVVSWDRRFFQPYYVLSPYRRCDAFELRAKFDTSAPPQRIWKLDGVPYRLVDEGLQQGATLALDAVGEVVVTFSDLYQGLSYGVQWQP
jgi:hypothetical protein